LVHLERRSLIDPVEIPWTELKGPPRLLFATYAEILSHQDHVVPLAYIGVVTGFAHAVPL
jgi:hypothetical protein